MAMAMPAPHFGPWTERDLLSMPDDGQRYEIVEGRLLVSPTPSGRHQGASGRLYRLLAQASPPHLETVEALGVSIPGTSFLVPDILTADRKAIWANTSGIIDPKAVSLVVEIISPSSVLIDMNTKPALYARAGIPNFWRVEMEEPSVAMYHLVAGSYQEVAVALAGDRLTVSEPFEVSFDPADLVS
jgi:Uma2 family endonuclease